MLSDNALNFPEGKVYDVRSNFYGNPIENGGIVDDFEDLPDLEESLKLPDDLPPAQLVSKAIVYGLDIIKMLFMEDEYLPVSLTFGITSIIMIILVIFVPVTRTSIITFAVCFSIVAFLALLGAAARSGKISKILPFRGGGGSFGGGGVSRRW